MVTDQSLPDEQVAPIFIQRRKNLQGAEICGSRRWCCGRNRQLQRELPERPRSFVTGL